MARVVFAACCLPLGLLTAPSSVGADAPGAAPMCVWPETASEDVGAHEVMHTPWSPDELASIVEATPTIEEALALAARGEHAQARTMLREAATRFPRVRDYLAVREADVAYAQGALTEALVLYASAEQSVSAGVRLEASVGRVRMLLELDDPRGMEALPAILEAHANEPMVLGVRFAEGRAHERRGHVEQAVVVYRALDLAHPGSEAAAQARERLVELERAGYPVAPPSVEDRVERASRLVQSGPADEAERSLAALLDEASLVGGARAQVLRLAARVARFRGRFPEADAYLREADTLAPPVVPEGIEPMPRVPDAEATIRRITRGRAIGTVHPLHLPTLAQLASLSGERALLDATVTRALTDDAPARVRFQVAMAIAGGADDTSVLRLLDPMREGEDEDAIAARYQHARALERLGRLDEARAVFASIDRSSFAGRYYGIWATERLRALRIETEGHELDVHGDVQTAVGTRVTYPSMTNEEAANALDALATTHARTYPWLRRAEDLLRLGSGALAQRELEETYLAWRETSRRRSRSTATLDYRDRLDIARVAASLGDHATAIAFGARYGGYDRPRAYEAEVVAASRRYGVDPNLVFAVMRVESGFSPRALSYAGAMGLMQIMPRTGTLAAEALGRRNFDVNDLYDPETNIELGTWYLASLIERFDGRVPLAIAAYNGGPHNVRAWIAEHGEDLPVDALLERIPFEQTHRYVRRVLVHYAAYRAEQGLPMVELPVTIAPLRPDTVGF